MALGEVVAAPDLAVKTFTRAIGDDVWIYGMLGVHYGACTVSDLKIGDTLASSMGSGDAQFVHHLTPGPRTFSLCPNDIDQADFQEELVATTSSATPVVRSASSEGEAFEFDFFLPGGLHFQKDDGRILAASVTLTVRYREIDADGDPIGDGSWTAGISETLTSTTKEPWRVTRALGLPMGLYEFEVVRSLKPDANEKRHDQVALTAIRAIAYRAPVTDETLSVIEFAIRATALNQGTLAPITCRIIPIAQTWTGSAWGTPEPTSNPAALTRWLLTGPAAARPLTSDQADVGLRQWSLLADEYDWTSNIYLTEARTQADAMDLLEQAGRASIYWDGAQTVASTWVEKPIPRQLFTGSNLKDHRWQIAYPEPMHAFRVEFQNLDEGGEPDEVFVYADGYGAVASEGIEAATLTEALRLEGQKTAERAVRDGRWELGRRIHRRRVDTWTADIEHLVSRYGDRVRLAWWRLNEGSASGRVLCRRWSGDDVVGLRLTQPVTFQPGEDYAVDLRLADSLQADVPVVNPATDAPVTTRELVFVEARGAEVSPAARDLVAFGTATRVSEDVEIIGIEPGEGHTASLMGVRYVAPLLLEGETGPIPPLQTRLTRERSQDPPAPTLLGVQVDDTGVRVGFSMPPWRGSPVTGFTCRWRPKPEVGQNSGWVPLPALDAGSMTLTTPPLRELPVVNAGDPDAETTRVEIEIRALTAAGRSSQPLQVTAAKGVPPQPLESAWSVIVRGPDEDGSQQPGLSVVRLSSSVLTPGVIIEYARQNGDPWAPAYAGPATLSRYDITGLAPLVPHWVGITNTSPQGVPGQRRVYGPLTVGALTAGDSVTGRRTQEVVAGLQATLQGTIEELLGLANDRASGHLLEANRRLTEVRDLLDRLMLLANIDPIARTAVVRGDVMLEGEDETIAQTFTLVRAAAAAASAAVALEQLARIAGDEAEATARIAGLASAGSALAAADIALRVWTNGQIATATINLATNAHVAAAVGAAALSLQGYTDGQIASATAGLATTAAVAASISAAALSLQSYTDGQIATATAGLTTAAQLASAIAGALIQAQLQVDAYAATAALTFAGLASFNGLVSTVGIQGTAVSGLQSRDNTAHLELIAAAGGGVPARIGIASAAGSSDIALEASRIWWGLNTVFHAATGQLRTSYGGASRRVLALGAPFGPDDLWMWTGPASVAFGDETFANATGAAESDGDSYYGGRTLSGPFDSGALSSTIVALSTTWAVLAEVEKTVNLGAFLIGVEIETTGDAPPDAEGFRVWDVELSVMSVAWDYSESEQLIGTSAGGVINPGGSASFVPGGVGPSWTTYAGTKRGRRRLILFARIPPASATTSASYRNARLHGFYAA